MRYHKKYSSTSVKIEPAEILQGQGIPDDRRIREKYLGLIESAMKIFLEAADPSGVAEELSISGFERIYAGENLNLSPAPLERVFPRCSSLCLFAVTLGSAITGRISDLFRVGDYAVAGFLDQMASVGVEKTAEMLQRDYFETLVGKINSADLLVRYSPGYCGWDITGQRELFGFLKPVEIGLSLNGSCLMMPLKSISGVMVAGPRRIHEFNNDFAFCTECLKSSCRDYESRAVFSRQENQVF